MENIKLSLDQERNDFIVFILQSLNLPVDEFLNSVANPDCCYEKTIYKWSIRLFEHGRTKEQALKIIFKARILYFIRRTNIPDDQENKSSKNLVELLQMLKSNDQYRKLSEAEKLIVQQKINELIGSKSSKEIIGQILENMNPLVVVEKETNMIKIFGNTLDRINKKILLKLKRNKK